MNRKYEIITTDDGSHTLQLPGTAITFHSTKGAIQESEHVFIQTGFDYCISRFPEKKTIRVFEVGFGTGLNALLTAMAAARNGKNVVYEAIDLHPVPGDIYARLNYPQLLDRVELYKTIMQTGWEQLLYISPFFKLHKIKADLRHYSFREPFDIIYFDAFAPGDQDEMWSGEICKKIFDALNSGGVLVTYCSKSIVRKTLEAAGFHVEKIPGPPGKREIIRALRGPGTG